MTLEWLIAWWNYYGTNRELVLLVVEDNNRALAVAPLMSTTYALSRFKLRKIEFIGTPSSDYHTFLFGDESLLCARMLLEYIKERLPAWDCMEMKDMPQSSVTARVLRAVSGESLELKERKMDLCPSIPLPVTFEEYFRKLGRSTRKKLRQWERRLRRDYKAEIREYHKMGSIEEAMRIFFELHQKRWQAKHGLGLFADRTFCDFHLEVAKRFAEKGWLRLYFLTANDEAVSAAYAFSYQNKLYYYLCGFDPRYSKYGVGNLMTKHLVRISIEEGLTELDLMRGDHPHKRHWNTIVRRNIELNATRWRPVPKVYNWMMRSDLLPILSERLYKYIHVHAST